MLHVVDAVLVKEVKMSLLVSRKCALEYKELEAKIKLLTEDELENPTKENENLLNLYCVLVDKYDYMNVSIHDFINYYNL